MKRIHFEQFIDADRECAVCDHGIGLKTHPSQHIPLNSEHGEGCIKTFALLGGAGLVVTDMEVHEDVEIFVDNAQQSGLSFTVCLAGRMESRGKGDACVIRLAGGQTMFQFEPMIDSSMSSVYKSGQRHQYVSIYLSDEWLTRCGEPLGLEIVSDRYWQGTYNSGAYSEPMLLLAETVLTACQRDEPEYHLLSAKALELWACQLQLLRELRNSDELTGPQHSASVLKKARDVAAVKQAAEILRGNLVAPPGLIELARQVGINDNKLKKGFKELYNTTVFAYLRRQRLLKAKQLIQQHGVSVTDAACKVGYSNAGHFATLFKKNYGVSPSTLDHG